MFIPRAGLGFRARRPSANIIRKPKSCLRELAMLPAADSPSAGSIAASSSPRAAGDLGFMV